LDRRAGRQQVLGLSLPCSQLLRAGVATLFGGAAQTGARRIVYRRRQRLELVVWSGAPFSKRPRIRRALSQASFERLSGAGGDSAGLPGAANHWWDGAALVQHPDALHSSQN